MRTVLLLEDSHGLSDVLIRLLGYIGWQTTLAETVAEGMAALAMKPAVLIADLMLPDGDGKQVIDEARRIGISLVIAMTGLDQRSRPDVQADHYLVKGGFGLSELERILEQACPKEVV